MEDCDYLFDHLQCEITAKSAAKTVSFVVCVRQLVRIGMFIPVKLNL